MQPAELAEAATRFTATIERTELSPRVLSGAFGELDVAAVRLDGPPETGDDPAGHDVPDAEWSAVFARIHAVEHVEAYAHGPARLVVRLS